MKKLNITSDKVSQSLINAMKTYKIKPTLKTTLSEAMNNPNLKAFDELTKKRKIQHNRSFLDCINIYITMSACVFQLTEGLSWAYGKITGLIPPLIWLCIIISGSVGAIFSKHLMSDTENAQRNKEWEADIKKLPKNWLH